MDLQRLQDEMELTKLNYDSLLRNERSTKERVESMTTKVDSVEKKIEALSAETTERFKTLEKKITSIADLLAKIEGSAVLQQRPGKEIAPGSETRIDQVSLPFSEPERSPTTLGYRGIENTLANRDKLLRNIDMSVFAGPDFFRIGNYNEEEKLHLVSLSLEGPVEPFTSWNQFTQRMLDRFGGPIDNDPAARLFCLRQEGDIDSFFWLSTKAPERASEIRRCI
ncbi:hypothetical protein Bca52824_035523 [Brassica carinata]|uniref:Retrotransposon gag domain-containing protein n=1 Tax=Brassica carinata TaxID=52824 RepID=A0A8X7S3U8_BRACI|nr:hypothetical protein Bca52824_035523 [Brassica carinata]